ncbi:MAG: acyl-ACP--UDP-N-acetylglucosamine O-acyltransferase [Planctomycetota bacterium]|nr:MAG: acyl-ACP--UDP-N-acetylglucosamine O-acyltransferase [Planctomycetota bacterium]REJ91968.1 MAG: acyl-ACP--UDP-N-acetylglucosamine O-acyltransferase [Planctomycetota bacterium]REK27245.1 MAG: acyl-ACP--UDP-N-acetylglucosamine O-acyltransferase [Planctomycetota bacterium]REK36733.1 MAG: acyl-ACP--UDP-N-acetylglucosamine O-acyltransferase [Planctomycetota bacterium]
MNTKISPLACVDPRAEIGERVEIGPFCLVGPEVVLGDDCILDSHVTLTARTQIGNGNRFWPNCVIGAEPQDKSYAGSNTRIEIGNGNQFREGVTVNRGADKEDGCTRIGDRNLLMSNAHVAHNCHVYDDTILVNGVLLGGHVHVQDRAIISGNSVVHHFSTIGTLAFVSGGCRVPNDVPPYMLWAGSDDPSVRTINLVGLQRSGMSREAIGRVKLIYRMLYREHKSLETVVEQIQGEFGADYPPEVRTLVEFLEAQKRGRMGRAREPRRDVAKPQAKAA